MQVLSLASGSGDGAAQPLAVAVLALLRQTWPLEAHCGRAAWCAHARGRDELAVHRGAVLVDPAAAAEGARLKLAHELAAGRLAVVAALTVLDAVDKRTDVYVAVCVLPLALARYNVVPEVA